MRVTLITRCGVQALSIGAILMLTIACGGSPSPTPAPTPNNVAVEAQVTSKGILAPRRHASLAFGAGGLVAQITVTEGQAVRAGALLAELDKGDGDLQVQAAQDALRLAQDSLAQLKAPAGPDQIAAAQATYDSARTALDRIEGGPTDEELVIQNAAVTKAKAALNQAQAAFDRVGGASNPQIGMLPQSLQLQSATLDYQAARANYEKATKPDPVVMAQARAAVEQTKATLRLKQTGPSAEEVAVAEARVHQAQTALQQAQQALTKSKLVAPFDGVVTQIQIHPGEVAQTGVPVLTLADVSELHVDTTDLDEYGSAHISVNQPTRIRVNAFANKTLQGKVTAIGLQPVSLATGDVSYVAMVALSDQDPDLRWGMTVRIEFLKESQPQ